MTIPHDWLSYPVTGQEVEERLAIEGASDVWLRQWRKLLSLVLPDDELWAYFAIEQADPAAADDWDLSDLREGYAIVREGEVVETIGEP